MAKPKLVLPENWNKLTHWNHTLCRMLINSNVFDIRLKKFPSKPNVARINNWHLMEVNGHLVGVDTWDTYAPTSHLVKGDYFDNIYKNVEMVLKIQYYKCDQWNKAAQKIHRPIRSWTIFPSNKFKLEAFKWAYSDHKLMAILTGRNDRFGRQPWVDWCNEQPDFVAGHKLRLSDDEFIAKLASSRWGLVLKGLARNHDGKNRRECEFSSCGMPLVLNYTPTYEFPMQPGVHFVLLNKPEDLASLRYIDPRPYAYMANELYNDHFSPFGMAKDLLKIVS